MRKLFILGMAVVTLVGCVGNLSNSTKVDAAEVRFSDISDHWAKESIQNAVTKGYVDGYEDSTFRPDQSVTRAEFIKMAVTAQKIIPTGTGDAWYSGYVKAAVEAGFHKYEDFNTGDMNTPITRQEMARIVVRAADPAQQGEADVKKLVYEAVKKGLIQGLSGGELGLSEATTRAQSVTVIERILTVKSGGTLEVDKNASSFAEVEWSGTNIQTMWGIKAKTIPMTFDLPISTKITMDKLLVIDLTNENDPYRWMFPYLLKANHKPVGDEYLVALHLNVSNEFINGGQLNINRLLGPTGFVYAIVPWDKREEAPIHDLSAINLAGVESAEGWYMMTRSKKEVDDRLNAGKKVGLHFDIVNEGAVLQITE